MDIVFLIVCKIDLFCFIEALNSKRILNTLKNLLRQQCCSFHFGCVTNTIVLTLQVYFAGSDIH